MNRQEMIEVIAERTGETKAAVGRFLDAFIDTVQTTVAAGGKVSLVGFGGFEAVKTAARNGRNPGTGEVLHIPAISRPRFSPGLEFRTLVRQISTVQGLEAE